MNEPLELSKFLEEDFGMAFTVTCNECGEDVTNVQEIDNAYEVITVPGTTNEVDDEAVVIVAIHECEDSDEDDDDDDWDDEDEDE